MDYLEDTIEKTKQETGMKTEPRMEHEWLQQLVGTWIFESECTMKPDNVQEKFNGMESVISIGGLWIQGESHGEMPGCDTMADMVITLGYDPVKQYFVGTWIGSMMPYLWVYQGSLDADKNILTLHTEGPSCHDENKLTKYTDIIEIKSSNQRTLTSLMQGEDGEWHRLVTTSYQRTQQPCLVAI